MPPDRSFGIAFALAVGVVSCADSGAHEHTHPEGAFDVRYSLAWNDAGVSRTGDGWQTTTDLGYLVRVDRGWLVSYSIQLVPCAAPTEVEANRASRALRRIWAAISPIGTAWAGHGNDSDVSIVLGTAESFAQPVEWSATTVRGEGAYCTLHYLVARADDELLSGAQSLDLDRLSLVIEGAWSADGSEWTDLSVESSTGFGALVPLSDVAAPGATAPDLVGAGPIDVRLERQLATLFDGIDFAGNRGDNTGEPASNDDIARAVVRSAVSDTLTTVTPAR